MNRADRSRGKTARADASRARRAAFHGRRCATSSGTTRLEAARAWLRVELAHAGPIEAEQALSQAAVALERVARGLNTTGGGGYDHAA
jgi:hypothetical protein